MMLKRFLSLMLALTLVAGILPAQVFATETGEASAPALPVATVTEIENDDLTFAMNFKADQITDDQMAYYKDWFADFVLTVNKDVTFNANGGADGFLSGQYDAWSQNWVNVPFEAVKLEANKPLKIMEYAAETMGQSGLQITCADVYESVKDFDCGVFFEPEFLLANPDLQVTLELRIYNPENQNESYAIGNTYTFTVPELTLPTATVTPIENEDLTFALNFKADKANAIQLATYSSWYADFELTVNKDVTFNANGGADGYLSGQYDAWSENWVNVPFDDVTLAAGQSLKIMEYAAELMGESGLQVTYADVYNSVKDFDCGVYFTPEFLAANPDLEVKLELRMYNPADESESYAIGESYNFTVELPTATVTKIENEDLTFALNFLADEATDAQLAVYNNWYADFELTVNKDVTFNAGGGANGYLSGQYDEWSENWVNVPFNDVTLNANTPLKIMEYAAELMGQSGLKYTYGEVYEFVKDFNCGVFFEPEFLAANPDLEVNLELRMYNPANENESYAIGETYTFTVPELPTATVTEIENEDLTFALNFEADEVTDDQLAYYADWYADFVLTVNKEVTFNANGNADGYLSGQYDAYGENWVNVPFDDATLTAGQSLKIMEYAAELMGQSGLKYTYGEVYEFVKNFNCGVFFEPEFLAENLDLVVTLELRMYNPKDESVSYAIGRTHTFTAAVACNTRTEKLYGDVSGALAEAAGGDTVKMLRDYSEHDGISYLEGVTLDLNGQELTAASVAAFSGNYLIDSTNGDGLLKTTKGYLMLQENNPYVPIWSAEAEGYVFTKCLSFQEQVEESDRSEKYVFLPKFDPSVHPLLAAGADTSDVKLKVEVSWDRGDGTIASQFFSYSDELVQQFLDAYDPATGRYGKAMYLSLTNVPEGLTLSYAVYASADRVNLKLN